jgi:beta-glucosidase
LYPFGFGLSYTNYTYGKPTLSNGSLSGNEKITVSVEVSNTGKFDGEEIVQLYIRDNVSSATRPVKELKEYQRVVLNTGETKTVKFTLDAGSLAFYDINMEYCVEPGEFTIMTGSSSARKDLKITTLTVNDKIEL